MAALPLPSTPPPPPTTQSTTAARSTPVSESTPDSSPTPTPTPIYTIRQGQSSDIPLLAAIERSAGELFRTVGLESVADDEPMPAVVLGSYAEAGNLWVATFRGTMDGEGARTGVEEERREEGSAVFGGRGQEAGGRKDRIGEEGDSQEQEEEEVVGFLAAFPLTITGTAAASQDTFASANKTPPASPILLHIAELSVHSSHHRRGLGRRLVQHLETTARERRRTQETARSWSPSDPESDARLQSASYSEAPATQLSPSSTPTHVSGLSLTTYRDLPFNGPFYISCGFTEVTRDSIQERLGKRAKELWDEEQENMKEKGRERRAWYVKWL